MTKIPLITPASMYMVKVIIVDKYIKRTKESIGVQDTPAFSEIQRKHHYPK